MNEVPSICLTHGEYTIGWVCALPKEQTAAFYMLEGRHADLPNPIHDHNAYILGNIGKHNIVIACLPMGRIGNNNAATVATRMIGTFPNIKVGLMVGIGGGVSPNVRLGDVVVSCPKNENPAVIQWDMGKTETDGKFKRTGSLNSPPTSMLTALSKLETTPAESRAKMLNYVNLLRSQHGVPKGFVKSDLHMDVLYEPSYSHVSRASATVDEDDLAAEDDCRLCDEKMIVNRPPREEAIMIHYGLIASGNQVIKDAQFRNKLKKDFNGVLCVEMEAAGLMNDFPCIVIRGICDYADSHKNKVWQEYAAAIAAAYAKALLTVLPVSDVDKMQTIQDYLPSSFIESARNFISPFWSDKRKETVSVSAGPEQTQIKDGSKDQSDQMPPNQTAKSSQAKTNVTGDQTETKNVYIAVMGVTGAGKSSLISLCTGKSVKIGHELKSCTTDVEDITFMLNSRVCVHLIDTPGFDDTYRSDVQVLQDIAHWFSKSFEQGTKLSGMIYLHRITDVRMTGSARRNLIMFQKLCGEKVYSSVVLATTMWGLIDETTGVQRERELAESEEFWGYMHKKGSRIFRHTQTRESCLNIIQHILSFDSTIILELQDEIVNQGHQIEDTKAGVQLNEDIIREREKHQAELLAMKEQMQEAIALHDAELQRILREECDKLEENIRLNEMEQAKLKQNLAEVQARKDREFLEFKKKIEADIGRELQKYKDDNRRMKELISRNQKPIFKWPIKKQPSRDKARAQTKRVNSDTIPLHKAVRNGKADAVKLLLDQGASIKAKDGDGNSPLHLAAWKGNEYIAKLLLDRGANIKAKDKDKDTPLHHAASYGNSDVVKLLLNHGAYIEVKNNSEMGPLHYAACQGNENTAKLLLNRGASIEAEDNDGFTPLYYAARYGNTSVAKLLLDHGAKFEAKSAWLQAPLHHAIQYGNTDVVKLLLDYGAYIEAKDEDGCTPLHHAAQHENSDVVTLLLDHGAYIEAKDDKDNVPLHLAAWEGNEYIAKLLLNKDANIKAKNIDGDTPLHDAARHGNADMVKLLLDHGANFTSRNDKDKTPFCLALENGKGVAAKLLGDREADIQTRGNNSG